MDLDYSNIDFDSIVGIGDIHGAFKQIVNKANDQYKLTNSLLICCGDFGMGFYKENYYRNQFKYLNLKLKKTNNILIALRGNHDDPQYFKDNFIYSNIKLLKDYSVVTTPDKVLLLVGGAISVDRIMRIKAEEPEERGVPKQYWRDENFNYNEDKLKVINEKFNKQITHVFTHSSPSFCQPTTKEGIRYWIALDPKLDVDCSLERHYHTRLFDNLIMNKQPIRGWYYGHFHFSKFEYINNIKFQVLDIEEFGEVR